MEQINAYINENRDRFLEELFNLIRIPSVSAKPEHGKDMYATAEKLKEYLLEAGADRAEIIETKGQPVVFGEKITDKSLPTVLVYGHYDVQPVEPLELWDSAPFEPEVRDGMLSGYRVAWIDPGGDFRRLGLKEDDVIVSLNDVSAARPGAFMQAFNGLRGQPGFHLSLERSGALIGYTYLFD